MARIKIQLPDKFTFSCSIPVRITDLNYGGHVGNDALLGLIHEARIQFLQYYGYTEMNFGGTGMIMTDVAIEFKSELFYGDELTVSVASSDISRIGFDLLYKLEKETNGVKMQVAIAKTGMICFDYKNKKITGIPDDAKEKLLA